MRVVCSMLGHKFKTLGAEVRRYKRTGYVDERFPVSLGTYTSTGTETVYHLQCERCGEVFSKTLTGSAEGGTDE